MLLREVYLDSEGNLCVVNKRGQTLILGHIHGLVRRSDQSLVCDDTTTGFARKRKSHNPFGRAGKPVIPGELLRAGAEIGLYVDKQDDEYVYLRHEAFNLPLTRLRKSLGKELRDEFAAAITWCKQRECIAWRQIEYLDHGSCFSLLDDRKSKRIDKVSYRQITGAIEEFLSKHG